MLDYTDDTPIRPLELEPAEPAEPVATVTNPEPVSRIRPLELDAADDLFATAPASYAPPPPPPAPLTFPRDLELARAALADARARHGVQRRGEGDQYCTAETAIPTAKRARELFGLDWTVSKHRVQAVVGGRAVDVPDKRAIVRDDTGEVLAIMGAGYGLLQNDALDLLDAISNEAPIVRGGVWDGGRRVWLQTAVTTFDTPSGPAEGNALAATSHDGSMALSFTAFGTVVVCRNTFRMNLRGAPNAITIRHTANAARMVEQLRDGLDLAREHFAALQREFLSWGRRKVGARELQAITDLLFPRQANATPRAEDGRNKRLDAFMETYESGPGAMPGTAWGLAMGVTRYQEHIRRIRSGGDRFARAWEDSTTAQALQLVRTIASA